MLQYTHALIIKAIRTHCSRTEKYDFSNPILGENLFVLLCLFLGLVFDALIIANFGIFGIRVVFYKRYEGPQKEFERAWFCLTLSKIGIFPFDKKAQLLISFLRVQPNYSLARPRSGHPICCTEKQRFNNIPINRS